MKKGQRPQFGLRIKQEVHDWLLAKSVREDRSMNWIVSKVLEDAMLKEQQEKSYEK